jgi:hypothetical protein
LDARHGGSFPPFDAAVVVVLVVAAVAVVDVAGAGVVVPVLVTVLVGAGLPAAVAVVDGADELPVLPQAASSIATAATMIRRLRSFPFTPVRGVVPVSRAHHGP